MFKLFGGILMAGLFLAGQAFAADQLDAFKGQKGNIDIAGGTAHIPVMTGAARQIMEANPDIRITVTGGGSGVGVQKVGEGLVQIGNTGRALKEKEIANYGLVSFPFAIDGVAAAANPKNPVNGLPARSGTGRKLAATMPPFRSMCAKMAAERVKRLRNAAWTRASLPQTPM